MVAGEVRVEGARRFRKTLRAAGDDLLDLRRAHGLAALIAADEARRLVPVGDSGKLGRTIRSAGTKTAAIVRAGNNSSVRYAGPVHWGWFRKHIPKNPFLSRGAQRSESRWLPVYEEYVETALNSIEGL